jgi:kynureninase
MFETHIRYHGLNPDEVLIEIPPRKGEYLVRHEDILNAIDKHHDEIALVLFSGINYYTGQVFDIKAITDAAHTIGAMAGFDLAHAAGNISLQLHDWNVDFGLLVQLQISKLGSRCYGWRFY